jgi:hypothetical protein
MKFFSSVLMFLVVSISLHAAQYSEEQLEPDVYPKKIIFGNYYKKSRAEHDFQAFRKEEIYKKLYDLAQKNNFMIHYRPLAEYTIFVMEPIQTRKVFYEAFKIIKQRFPGAYHLSAEGLDVPKTKSLPPIAQDNFSEVSSVKPSIVKKETAQIDSIEPLDVEKNESDTIAKSSSKIGEPIFKVEEVSDEKISVASESTTKKAPKDEQKPEAEIMLANNDVKEQMTDDALVLENNNTVIANDMNVSDANISESDESNESNISIVSNADEEKEEPKILTTSEKTQVTDEVVKKESHKEETSYFTFSNIVIVILLLIFVPFLYRKFKKNKLIYDKY